MKKIYFTFCTLIIAVIVAISCQNKDEQQTVYPYLIEYLITGDANPVTVVYTNETGGRDSLQVSLPYQVRLKQFTGQLASMEVRKNKNAGTITVETLYRGQSKDKKSTSLEHGQLIVKADNSGLVGTSEYQPSEWPCSTYNGNQLRTGPKGGCYYINSNGNKTYVDRDFCRCD